MEQDPLRSRWHIGQDTASIGGGEDTGESSVLGHQRGTDVAASHLGRHGVERRIHFRLVDIENAGVANSRPFRYPDVDARSMAVESVSWLHPLALLSVARYYPNGSGVSCFNGLKCRANRKEICISEEQL